MPANQAYGTLFEGLGSALQVGLNTYDTVASQKIEIEADKQVNQVVEDNMPPGLEAGIEELQTAKEARDQGAYSDVQFTNEIWRVSKRLRSQYAEGYGPQIEQAVSSALGRSTANDARKARLAAIDSANSAMSDEHKNFREWMETGDNLAYLNTATVKARFKALTGRSMDQAMLEPRLEEFNYMKLAVSEAKSYKTDLTLIEDNARVEKSINDEKAKKVVNTVFRESFNEVTNEDARNFLELKRAVVDPKSPGGTAITDDEREQVATYFNKLQTKFNSDLTDSIIRTGLSVDEAKKMTELGQTFMTNIRDSLLNEQYGMLTAAVRTYEGGRDERLRKLVGDSDFFSMLDLLVRSKAPSEVVNSTLNMIYSKQPEAMQTLIAAALTSSISGEKTPSEVLKIIAEGSKNPSAESKAFIDTLTAYMGSEAATPEGTAKAALNIFTKRNEDLLENFVQKNRIGVFEKFMTPRVFQLLKESGDPNAMKYATNWGTNQFATITKPMLDNAFEGAAERIWWDVKYENGFFQVNPRDRTWGEYFTQLNLPNVEASQGWKLRQSVDELNKYIATMRPFWKEQGIEEAVAMSLKYDEINSVEKNGTFLQQIGGALANAISGTSAEEDNKDKGEGKFKIEPTSGKSVIEYANEGAIRNLDLTNELESKINTAVQTVFGDGYRAQVFSGGQPKKGRRTGTIRHDEGKAADIYIIGPDGKRIKDVKQLDKLKKFWQENKMGSVGTYMRGAGIHLDEWTEEELLPGMSLSWNY
jgi:hypothetical protein